MTRLHKHLPIVLNLSIYSSLLFSGTNFPGTQLFSSSIYLSMGGAGYLRSSVSSFNINPAVYEGKRFSASIIKYPASITSQNIGITIPMLNNGFGNFSINHISYGTFEGYDEDAELTRSYSSSDTKISASYSKGFSKFPLKIGIQSNIYFSNYDNHDLNIFTLNTGIYLKLKPQKALLGVSIHDFGKNNSRYKIDLIPKLVISGSKELKYLPLKIYMDLIPKESSPLIVFLGGEFDINKNFQFRIGSSTRKFNQNIEKDLFSSIAGATGLGFGYDIKNAIIHYGVFMYGTGALIHGIDIVTNI